MSNARPREAVTTHLKWDILSLNWEKKTFLARVVYNYSNLKEGNRCISLDVRELDILSVSVNGEKAAWALTDHDPIKPEHLQIEIPEGKRSGTLEIEYETTPGSSGCYWVDKELTAGKEHPLFYTLMQPNDGAGVLPGQHSPQVRLTWEVSVETGSGDLMALSSVKNNPTVKNPDGSYSGLRMDRACPLYLNSVVVGNLVYKEFDGRTGVYSDPAEVDRVVHGAQDLPKMMAAAEEILGPYQWGRYAIVSLSKAFPYMGMEHPCASMCGQVCLEQPCVFPHELAHSWTGNDTTNCNWGQFFFNEGWTVFAEALICEKLYGADYAAMVFENLLQEAREDMEEFKNQPEVLKLISDGTSAEFTRIPYAKGALFFFMLRNAIGHEEFSRFTKDYMQLFFQGTMSDERFKLFLAAWLKNEKGIKDTDAFFKEHKIDEWLYGTNMPINAPVTKSNLLERVKAQAKLANEGKFVELPVEEMKKYDVTTMLGFLGELKGMDEEALDHLNDIFAFGSSEMISIRGAWALLLAKAEYFTPENEDLIVNFVIDRNSNYEGHKISAALCKSEKGRALAQRILQEGKGRLFTTVLERVQKNLA